MEDNKNVFNTLSPIKLIAKENDWIKTKNVALVKIGSKMYTVNFFYKVEMIV